MDRSQVGLSAHASYAHIEPHARSPPVSIPYFSNVPARKSALGPLRLLVQATLAVLGHRSDVELT